MSTEERAMLRCLIPDLFKEMMIKPNGRTEEVALKYLVKAFRKGTANGWWIYHEENRRNQDA